MAPNIIKSTVNLREDRKDFLRELSEANATSETTIINSAIDLLRHLGDLGARFSVLITPTNNAVQYPREFMLGFDLGALEPADSAASEEPKAE